MVTLKPLLRVNSNIKMVYGFMSQVPFQHGNFGEPSEDAQQALGAAFDVGRPSCLGRNQGSFSKIDSGEMSLFGCSGS